MANIGHWRDNAGLQIPGVSFTGFNTAAQIRNDAGAGLTRPTNSAVEVINALEAGHAKLFIANIKTDDTSNGRFGFQARFRVIGGTGNLFSTAMTGYNRNNNNRTAWVRVVGILYESSNNCQVELEWRRDTDAPTGGSLPTESDLQVVDIYYNSLGHYSETVGGFSNGGAIPTVLPLNNTVRETDANLISRVGNVVTIAGGNRRYLSFWTTAGQTGGDRTQRIGSLRYNGVADLATRSYMYQRSAANEYAGLGAMDIHQTGAASETLDVVVYRGDGVAADQGGANVDGSWVATPDATQLIVIELPWNTEVFRSSDSVGLQNISVTVDLPMNVMRDIDINNGGSFSQGSNTQMIVNENLDMICWSNIWVARLTVTSGTRLTRGARIDINGINQSVGEHGTYVRGNQGSQDTFGGSIHPGGVFAVGATDSISVEVFDAGDDGGNDRTQAETAGFMAINLDTARPIEKVSTRIIA